MAERVFERVARHRRPHVAEGLHARPAPTRLLLFVHTLGNNLDDCAFHERHGSVDQNGSFMGYTESDQNCANQQTPRFLYNLDLNYASYFSPKRNQLITLSEIPPGPSQLFLERD